MLQDLENALHCLQRARKATHIQANRAFFLSKYTSYGDFNRIESTIDSCILLLSDIDFKSSISTHEKGDATLAG